MKVFRMSAQEKSVFKTLYLKTFATGLYIAATTTIGLRVYQ